MTITLNKQSFDWCAIDVDSHLSESLGHPLVLPESLQEALDSNWATESTKDLLQHFAYLTGVEYEQASGDNTCNYENDLDKFFVYTVYAPVGASDWMWAHNCFVTIEKGFPGDPRYVGYAAAEVYSLGDKCLGESGFFEWNMGWYAQHLDRYWSPGEEKALDELNSELSAGFSNCPTSLLRDKCYDEPLWVEKRGGYVARPKEYPWPLLFMPQPPCYN